MEMIRKVYLCHESNTGEYSSAEDEPNLILAVPNRNIKVRLLEGYFAYLFYDVWETSLDVEGQAVTFQSKAMNHSATTYYGVRTWSLRDMLRGLKSRGAAWDVRRDFHADWRLNRLVCMIQPLGEDHATIRTCVKVDQTNFIAVPARAGRW